MTARKLGQWEDGQHELSGSVPTCEPKTAGAQPLFAGRTSRMTARRTILAAAIAAGAALAMGTTWPAPAEGAVGNGMAVIAQEPSKVATEVWGIGVAAPQLEGAEGRVGVALWWVPPGEPVARAELQGVRAYRVMPRVATAVAAKRGCRPTATPHRWLTVVSVRVELEGRVKSIRDTSRVAWLRCRPGGGA